MNRRKEVTITDFPSIESKSHRLSPVGTVWANSFLFFASQSSSDYDSGTVNGDVKEEEKKRSIAFRQKQ